MSKELIKINRLQDIVWVDCDNLDCKEDAVYEIVNLYMGGIWNSCESHLYDTIKNEMDQGELNNE